jgi:uncharacterized protein (DUF1684 family)
MKAKNIFLLLVIILTLIILFYSFTGSQDQTPYLDEIGKEREEKDHFMKTSAESPFAENKNTFKGLRYFPPDPKYKVTATLTPVRDKKVVTLTTNDGKEDRYSEYAHAEFDLGGHHNKLLILEIIETGPSRGKLFLAFGDETSARETYGAGRYLDVNKVSGSNTLTLDFNKAYNPYCAYTSTYSCPLPPAENLLAIPILAGEKTYEP